jgi:hypothetical protein
MKKCPCNLYCPAFSANHLNAAAKLQLDCHRLESFNHYLCSSQRTHRKSHHRTKGSASTIPPRKGQQRRQHATSTGRWPESILRHVAGLVFVTEYCFFADYDTGWSRTWARISQFRLNFTAIPAGPARDSDVWVTPAATGAPPPGAGGARAPVGGNRVSAKR